ncbi:DNA repair complementing XP-C cells [Micractinium conductrix]|uniref:DNA repair complementing XP-C cells n=1 Tax=Micractinium conductrix TaxID=554055 RepID=A0A2P6V679_9CHLO|nr:DNA repair complementing XP-C cells [Micractinium conductrix]|eukprot:PSC69591.1 DNA repair complementing XP-C cells [Micractinium conductrix]
MGGCCGKEAGPDAEIYRSAQRSRLPDTEADREARAAAAAAAEARQQKWAGTPVGKAALKSVKQVQEERAAGRPDSKDTVKDWLS